MTRKPSAWRHGYCDAIMGRESKCPFKAYPAQVAYLRGYTTGKSLSTPETAQILEFKQPLERG